MVWGEHQTLGLQPSLSAEPPRGGARHFAGNTKLGNQWRLEHGPGAGMTQAPVRCLQRVPNRRGTGLFQAKVRRRQRLSWAKGSFPSNHEPSTNLVSNALTAK